MIAALALRFAGPEYHFISNIIFNILLILLSLKVAVLLHEAGHLSVAKLMGGNPRRMVLGRNHEVYRGQFRKVKIVVHSNFNSGLAYSTFGNLRYPKARLMFYSAGGFIVNFLIAGILLWFFGMKISIANSIEPISAVIFANLSAGFGSLIPYYSSYQGMRLNSDGMSLLKIPFYSSEELKGLNSASDYLDAFDLFEEKRYQEAIEIYNRIKVNKEESTAINLNLGLAYLKLGEFEKSAEVMERILPLPEDKKFLNYKALGANALAWVYLVLNRIEEADEYSEMAYKLDPRSTYIIGTRGCTLIEKGDLKEGIELLKDQVDFNFPNNQTIAAAIYLMRAYKGLDKPKKVSRYHAFVEENRDMLEADEQLLYERAL